MNNNWYVYIVRCSDNSLYTGVACDVERRVQEHNTSDKAGARYTRGRRPVVLEYVESTSSRSAACKREYEIKSMCKVEKENLLSGAVVKKYRG